jgi:hypothetical protein
VGIGRQHTTRRHPNVNSVGHVGGDSPPVRDVSTHGPWAMGSAASVPWQVLEVPVRCDIILDASPRKKRKERLNMMSLSVLMVLNDDLIRQSSYGPL